MTKLKNWILNEIHTAERLSEKVAVFSVTVICMEP